MDKNDIYMLYADETAAVTASFCWRNKNVKNLSGIYTRWRGALFLSGIVENMKM